MKIRTQFALHTIGIILVPILVIGALVMLEFYREPERALLPGYREVSEMSGTEVSAADWSRLSRFINRKSKNVEYLVIGAANRVVYSTIQDYRPATMLSNDDIMGFIENSSHRYLYMVDSPETSGTVNYIVITRVLRAKHRPPDPILVMIRWVITIFLVLLVFSAAMSSYITRSITKSVTMLEENTRRIAAGDLDVVVEAKGSNEITSLTDSLNRMRLALKDEQARRSRFIMGISHDLKTPLALIKGYTEAISDGIADDPQTIAKSLEIVGGKVDQLEDMINDLIGFVKLNTGEWRQNLQNHALAPLLRNFCVRISSDAELLRRSVEYRIDLPDSFVVPLDERLFVRALENITTNAIRYTGEGGLIKIDATVEGGDAVIAISDDGVGIKSDDLPHIFDLFYRGTNSRREEGMGMGLSIVKSVADSHGWTVSAASDPGERTVFTLRIPAISQR